MLIHNSRCRRVLFRGHVAAAVGLYLILAGDASVRAQWQLGVTLHDLDLRPGIYGIGIARVTPGSPAQQAGLEPRDIIYQVNGRHVFTIADVQQAIAVSHGQVDLSVLDWRTHWVYELHVPLRWTGLRPVQPPIDLAQHQVNDITRFLGMPFIRTYADHNIPNAQIGKESDPYGQIFLTIRYNPQFLGSLYRQHGRWASLSVLAHEVAHHFHGDTGFYGMIALPWTKELRADYVSGYVLAKGGASAEEATRALRSQFSVFGTISHPDTPKRLAALSAGWRKGMVGP